MHNYQERYPEADEGIIGQNIQRLKSIVQRLIDMRELTHDLDIETVAEIIVRINSKGVVLSQADFAMSPANQIANAAEKALSFTTTLKGPPCRL